MAYRKTAKVKAHLESRRDLLIECAVDILAQDGIEAMTLQAVASRANVAMGSIYLHFPDAHEFRQAVIGHLLESDIAAMREAAVHPRPINALASALMVFYTRLETRPLARAVSESASYRRGIREEFRKLINRAFDLTSVGSSVAAAAALGALFGAFEASGPSRGSSAVDACAFVLRGFGVPMVAARAMATQAL